MTPPAMPASGPTQSSPIHRLVIRPATTPSTTAAATDAAARSGWTRRARPRALRARRRRPAQRRSCTSRPPRQSTGNPIRDPLRIVEASVDPSGEGDRMRTNVARAVFALALLVVVGVGSYAMADSEAAEGRSARRLSGEPGHLDRRRRQLRGDTRRQRPDLTYTLSYSGLEGTVQQAHIHFGKRVNGGVTVFLCGTAASPGPAGTRCARSRAPSRARSQRPTSSRRRAGASPRASRPATSRSSRPRRAGHAYANVHSSKWPGGEIRAQINDPNEKDWDRTAGGTRAWQAGPLDSTGRPLEPADDSKRERRRARRRRLGGRT